ncbi:MAG: 2'-5' RNA ligase family protein [Candidatus Levybacteria bacterium]|nr:2'-5' RNA ligase family protein [Candidatus Levybacteria bacterium]
MQTTTLNIAILPSDEVISQAIAMSKKIASEIESRFVLNLNTLIPHITVYQARYPNKNMDKLRSVARSLSLERELFEIKLNAITVSHETFLFWNCRKNLILQNLQRKVVELANPLREGLVPDSLADVCSLSEGDRYDVKHFGALLIGPRYQPHITITRLSKKEDAEKATKVLSGYKKLSFKPKDLILGYLGEHGTVSGIVENFRFR